MGGQLEVCVGCVRGVAGVAGVRGARRWASGLHAG